LGSAAIAGTSLRLTPADPGGTGAAWFRSLQPVAAGFNTTFQFQITDLVFGGADGFAFVVQRASLFTIGGGGGAIGYGGIPKSLAVEFDTWQNFDDPEARGDPNDNHVSVHSNGIGPNNAHEDMSLGNTGTGLAVDLSDGLVHTARIGYLPGTLSVYIDDLVNPVLSVAADLDTRLNLVNGSALVGFTAATGGARENHDILSWSFSAVPEPSSFALAAVGLLGLVARRTRMKSTRQTNVHVDRIV
jgi:hypothetical protein